MRARSGILRVHSSLLSQARIFSIGEQQAKLRAAEQNAFTQCEEPYPAHLLTEMCLDQDQHPPAIDQASAWMEQAREHLQNRDIASTLRALAAAEAAGADPCMCAGDRWQCWMLLGDFEKAWRESDSIRRRGAEDPNRFWDGSSWHGKRLMVRCLHGFGDAIQFLRYLPLLSEQAASVIVEAAPRLVPLLPMLDGVAEVITWGPDAPAAPPEWDVQLEVMELPYAFRSTLGSLPRAVPYLQPPGSLMREVASAMPKRRHPRVGLVWAGGAWNRERCLPFHLLEPLLRKRDVTWFSLQGDADNDAWRTLRCTGDSPLEDAADYGEGLLPLAAVMANLDLVISIDTMAAHMAGAMAKPVWLMLQHAGDWRWMLDRSDSPWYPTMRIFRQPSEGDWPGLIAEVERALSGWLQAQTATIESHAALEQL